MSYLELCYEHDACNIYHNTQLNVVQTQWKGLFVKGIELYQILDNIIEVLQQRNLNAVLADARKMKFITEEDQQWIIKDWYPRALAIGFNSEAIVLSKNTFNERAIRFIVQNYDQQKLTTAYFETVHEAGEWLKRNFAEKK